MISITLYITIAANDISSGVMLTSSRQLIFWFQLLQADNISFAERKDINPITASTPYWGSPIGVVIDITLAAVVVDETALTVVVDTAVVNIIVSSLTQNYMNLLKRLPK